MRELTEEEALLVSGGTREGAALVSSATQGLLGSAFSAQRDLSGLFRPTQGLDLRSDIDSMIRES